MFRIALIAAVMSMFGCATIIGTDTSFIPWRGDEVYKGSGGAVENSEGVEIWKVGKPDRPYKIIGLIVQNKATDEDTVNKMLFGDFNQREIVKLVKSNNGDGVVTLNDDRHVNVNVSTSTVATTISSKLAVFRYVNVANQEAINAENKINAEASILLQLAVSTGDTKDVSRQITNGADVNTKNKDGFTPLHLATQRRDKDIIELLIAKGADINAKNKDGFTPLHVSAIQGYKDVAQLMIDKGADVNAKGKDGITPLYVAAALGHKDVAEVLIEKGADVNAKTNNGITPLSISRKNERVAVTEMLLQHGAN